MADTKISGLTVGTPLSTDTFPLQRGGTNNYQSTFSNNIAGKVYSANGTTYPVGTLTDTQYLQVSGGSIISSAVTSGGGSSDGWNAMPGTTTYVSADAPSYVVSINANVGTLVQAGHRMKWTQGTTVGYGIVTNVGAYSSGTIPVTIYGGTAYTIGTAAIGSVYYSPVHSPYGFTVNPNYWTVTFSDANGRDQTPPTQNVWYNLGTATISMPIGLWKLSYNVMLDFSTNASQTSAVMFVTLSTANNSESTTAYTIKQILGGASGTIRLSGLVTLPEKIISLAAKTSYYLNAKTDLTTMASLYFRGDVSPTTIKLVSAYI